MEGKENPREAGAEVRGGGLSLERQCFGDIRAFIHSFISKHLMDHVPPAKPCARVGLEKP